jgi:hypothetical protein
MSDENNRNRGLRRVRFPINVLSSEISRMYGKTPEVTTEFVNKEYEIIRVDSLSGSVWIAHNLKNNSSPKYFFNRKEMEKWLV